MLNKILVFCLPGCFAPNMQLADASFVSVSLVTPMAAPTIHLKVTHPQLGFTIKNRSHGRRGASINLVSKGLQSELPAMIAGSELVKAEDGEGKCLCSFSQLSFSKCRQELQSLRKHALKHPFTVVIKVLEQSGRVAKLSEEPRPDMYLTREIKAAAEILESTNLKPKGVAGTPCESHPAAAIDSFSQEDTPDEQEGQVMQSTVRVPDDEQSSTLDLSPHAKVNSVLSGARSMVHEAQKRWQEEIASRRQLQIEAAVSAGPVVQHIVVTQLETRHGSMSTFRAELQGRRAVKLTWAQLSDKAISSCSRSVQVEAQNAFHAQDTQSAAFEIYSSHLKHVFSGASAGMSSLVFGFSAACEPCHAETKAFISSAADGLFGKQGVASFASTALLDPSTPANRGAWLEVHCVAVGQGGSFDVLGKLPTSLNMVETAKSPFKTQCRGIEVRSLVELQPALDLAFGASTAHDCQVAINMQLRHPLQQHHPLGNTTIIVSKAYSSHSNKKLIGSVKYGAIAASRWLADSQRAFVKNMLATVTQTAVSTKQDSLTSELSKCLSLEPVVHSLCFLPACVAKPARLLPQADFEAWTGAVASSTAALASICSVAAATSHRTSTHTNQASLPTTSPFWPAPSAPLAATQALSSRAARPSVSVSPPNIMSTPVRHKLDFQLPAFSSSSPSRTRIQQPVDQVQCHKAAAMATVRERLFQRAQSIKARRRRTVADSPANYQRRMDGTAVEETPRLRGGPPTTAHRSSPRQARQAAAHRDQLQRQQPLDTKKSFTDLLANYRAKYRSQSMD